MTSADKLAIIERQFVDLCLASRQPMDKAVRLRSTLRRRAAELSALANLDLSSRDWDALSLRVLIATEATVESLDKAKHRSRIGLMGFRILVTSIAVASMFGYAVWFELFGRLSLDFVYHPRIEDCATVAATLPQCRTAKGMP